MVMCSPRSLAENKDTGSIPVLSNCFFLSLGSAARVKTRLNPCKHSPGQTTDT